MPKLTSLHYVIVVEVFLIGCLVGSLVQRYWGA